MATKKLARAPGESITIVPLQQGVMRFAILGTTPFICNRVPEKAARELLMPYKKTAADRAGNLKHDPVQEFRASPYRMEDAKAPTVIGTPHVMFKAAMGTAALRIQGANKTELKQLVSVPFGNMPLYGTPRIFCAITRSADQARTPDVRTRAILPEWACLLEVTFTKPTLREQIIADLLSAAGRISGVGDWRQEKGSGSFGSFTIVSDNDPTFLRVLKQGRKVQQDALDNPVAYNDESRELLSWFDVETKRRGFRVAA